MTKPKQNRLNVSQIKAWVLAKKNEFDTLVESMYEDARLDATATNAELIDKWLRFNLHPNTYAELPVREKLCELLMEQDAEVLNTVFSISIKPSTPSHYSYSERNVLVKSFAEDLHLALTMNPAYDSYLETTQTVIDLHVIKIRNATNNA